MMWFTLGMTAASIYRWFSEERYRSWVSHGLLAAALALTPITIGSVMWAYGFRELGQTIEDLVALAGWHPTKAASDVDWLDHFGDFAAPAVVCIVGAAFGWWT